MFLLISFTHPHHANATPQPSAPHTATTQSQTSHPAGPVNETNASPSAHSAPKKINIAFVMPFVCMLLCIAIIPLINPHWWHENFAKVSAFWGVPMAVAMSFILPGKTIQTFVEFLCFIALVGSLFTISGGILIRGSFRSSPIVNTLFLAAGAVLASLIGTAGASMVLVRPMLRINSDRKSKTHVFVFFIFIVSNIGGSLTPLGDPPLFLGFLQGVPFAWPIIHMSPAWALNIITLLALFFCMDSIVSAREGGVKHIEGVKEKLRVLGASNFIFLGGVLLAAVTYGYVLTPLFGKVKFLPEICQMAIMWAMAGLSMKFTPRAIHEENGFSWFPIKEVAILFAAIFACMIPALNILEYLGGSGALKVTHPWQYFWMSGVLSSFLDNAPTYLTFLSLGKTVGGHACVPVLGGCVPPHILLAISMGSVFMGANSYIGNAPNFMVKSIAGENGVKMPHFFGYVFWAAAILVPLFLLDTLIFFRG